MTDNEREARLMRDFLPGDGSIAAIRAEHEADMNRGPRQPAANPYTLARVSALLAEIARLEALLQTSRP